MTQPEGNSAAMSETWATGLFGPAKLTLISPPSDIPQQWASQQPNHHLDHVGERFAATTRN